MLVYNIAPIGFYLLSETINKPIDVLHRPVPYFNEKLLMSVERTLKRFKPDQPFERSSWSIADDRNLFRRTSMSSLFVCIPLISGDVNRSHLRRTCQSRNPP